MDLVVYDDRDQRYVPVLVALIGGLLAAVVVGGLAFVLARQPAPSSASAAPAASAAPLSGLSTPRAGEQGGTDCGPALERAQAALELASSLEGALEAQTSVMDELLAGRLTREQVLDRALPPLTAGAKDRQAFLAAVTSYEQARAACQQ